MDFVGPPLHRWDVSPDEAVALQHDLARRIVREDDVGTVHCVAGVDVAYAVDDQRVVAAVAVLAIPSLTVVEIATAETVATFPYTPGLFSFREIPPIVDALAMLQTRPDLIVCDGHGIAHPRRLGLASHLGLWCDIPAIGCAKTRLTGTHDEPDWARGSIAALVDAGEEIGAVLRTQDGVRPVYVSPGHRISLAAACDWILRLTPRYRLPETTRAADHAVRLALARTAA